MSQTTASSARHLAGLPLHRHLWVRGVPILAEYDVDHSQVIEQLFGKEHDGQRSYGLIRFTLSDALVTVHSDGRLVTKLRDN